MSNKYILLGKTAGNEWLPVSLLYPNLDNIPTTYDSLEEAQKSKGRLKQLLASNPSIGKKVPLRIEILE